MGLGYVGLPLMLRFAEVGYRVVGIDVDESKNEMLNAGKSYIKHIPSEQIAKHQARDNHKPLPLRSTWPLDS